MNGPGTRDPFVDWLRATSLVVVVIWHWAFTILRWTPDGPSPTSPLGFLSGLWILTWLLQVLPVFFYVGGHVHLISWEHARARGERLAGYVWGHVRHLVLPAIALVVTWTVLGTVLAAAFDLRWIRGAVLLVLSPLWFLGVYVGLLVLLPLWLWLHRRYDVLVLVWLGGIALLADVLRFRYGVSWAGWVNLLVVWALAHQAGFFFQRLADAPRRWTQALLWAGLLGLAGLVFSGLYPGSMVGVPGDRVSNMGPPTFVIVALLVFQAGLAELIRPVLRRWFDRPGPHRFTAALSRFALPLFLFHTTGMALARGFGYLVFDHRLVDDRAPDLIWWVQRPLAILGPLVCTVPLIVLFGRNRKKHTV
ncbi:acyltransferase family protein [Amycolatopsis samaneae]|uniref:Acyltransferase family protein n=1 Tax=Amycolatopsis samaneae TaxID=664691 RepID=A0ABW5GRD8_9PSEU